MSGDMYDWEHCDHRGIGMIGCPVCDSDKGRVMIRQQRLDNRDLRAGNVRLTAKVAELEAENAVQASAFDKFKNARDTFRAERDAARAEESALRILWKNANAAAQEFRAEVESLKAQLAEARKIQGNLSDRLKSTQDWLDRELKRAESAEAQLAERSLQLSMMEKEAATQERFRRSAEEQLRVAREALERAAKCLSEPNPGITDTIWLNPDGSSVGPTLYEFICGRLAALSEISTKR